MEHDKKIYNHGTWGTLTVDKFKPVNASQGSLTGIGLKLVPRYSRRGNQSYHIQGELFRAAIHVCLKYVH